MAIIRETLVKVIIVACLLTVGSQAALTENQLQAINGQCKYVLPGSTIAVYLWSTDVLEGAGTFNDYVSTKSAKDYEGFEHPPPLNKMVRRLKKANMHNPHVITRVIEMSTKKIGPNYIGCQGNDYGTYFSVCLIFDKVNIVGADLTNFQDKMTEERNNVKLFSEHFQNFLNVINDFNRSGYYHNNINRHTIGVDFQAEKFYLLDPDFATEKIEKTSKPAEFVSGFDSPSLFTPGSFHKAIDDIYSGTMSFVDSVLNMNSQSHPYFLIPADKAKGGADKDCWTIRDDECIEYLANRYALLLCEYMRDNGLGNLTISDKFKEVYKTTNSFNWKKVDKNKIYADLNLPTLLRDLWLYKDFPLSGDEFKELFSMVRLNRKLI